MLTNRIRALIRAAGYIGFLLSFHKFSSCRVSLFSLHTRVHTHTHARTHMHTHTHTCTHAHTHTHTHVHTCTHTHAHMHTCTHTHTHTHMHTRTHTRTHTHTCTHTHTHTQLTLPVERYVSLFFTNLERTSGAMRSQKSAGYQCTQSKPS